MAGLRDPRSVLASALALGLALATSSAAAGAEPAGPVVVVEAPDDPAVRAVIEFPPGWRLEAAAQDPARRSINALTIDERCEVSTRRSDFADLTTDVDDFVVSLGPGSGFILMERVAIELPAGEAERVDFASEDGGRWSVYVVPDGGYMHELWCRGDELPDDRWLPIASTFELTVDESRTSSAFEPMVRRPDAGMAMAFGKEWQVRGSSTNQGLLYATSETAVCSVSDYSALGRERGWSTVSQMHDEYVAAADARSNLSVDEVSYLDLPAGPVGFADISFDDGTRAIRYSFAEPDSGTLLALFCVGDPTPDDRYMSLAESLIWLPVDEDASANVDPGG